MAFETRYPSQEEIAGGETPPWETADYEPDSRVVPEQSGPRMAKAISEREAAQLLPNAAEIRQKLRTLYHTDPPDVDIAKAHHFSRALGIHTPESIIIDPQRLPPEARNHEGFTALMKENGVDWPNDDGVSGFFADSIGTSLIHAEIAEKNNIPVDVAVAHENTHKGILLANIWNEGFAVLLDQIYSRLCGYRLRPTVERRPLSILDIGAFAVSAMCSEKPALFHTMLDVVSTQSAESFTELFTHMKEAPGFRIMGYLSSLDPYMEYPHLPEALRGVVPDRYFDESRIQLDAVMPLVIAKLKQYQARTGYAFDFPAFRGSSPSVANVVAEQRQNGHDPVTAALLRVLETTGNKSFE